MYVGSPVKPLLGPAFRGIHAFGTASSADRLSRTLRIMKTVMRGFGLNDDIATNAPITESVFIQSQRELNSDKTGPKDTLDLVPPHMRPQTHTRYQFKILLKLKKRIDVVLSNKRRNHFIGEGLSESLAVDCMELNYISLAALKNYFSQTYRSAYHLQKARARWTLGSQVGLLSKYFFGSSNMRATVYDDFKTFLAMHGVTIELPLKPTKQTTDELIRVLRPFFIAKFMGEFSSTPNLKEIVFSGLGYHHMRFIIHTQLIAPHILYSIVPHELIEDLELEYHF